MCHRQSLGDCAGRRRLRRLLPQRRQVIFTIIAGVRLPGSFAVGFELMAVQYGRGRGAQSWPRVLGCCAGTGYDCPQCRGNPAAIPRLLGRALSLRTSPSGNGRWRCIRKAVRCGPWGGPGFRGECPGDKPVGKKGGLPPGAGCADRTVSALPGLPATGRR